MDYLKFIRLQIINIEYLEIGLFGTILQVKSSNILNSLFII